MAISRVYKTEGIVLKRINLGEADKILTVYTPNLGKISAVAKGARRPKSKLGGHVETLNRSSMMLAKGRNLDIVTQSQTIDSHMALRSDLWLTSCALYICELVDRFTEEHSENYRIYKLLLNTLEQFGKSKNIQLLLRYFELHLLDYLGFRPQLQSCINCKSSLEPRLNYFSPSGGGILCPNCSNIEPVVRPITVNSQKIMRLIQKGSYEQVQRVKINTDLSMELEILLREYIRYLLEREVKSVGFLDQLRAIDPPV